MMVWIGLVFIWPFIDTAHAVDCYTCNVDFRKGNFDHNDSCLYPKDTRQRTSCSQESKYCQAIITRICGVFVQLQRTCETDCSEFCTEKGYGVEISDCTFCCNSSFKRAEECGFQGYKSDAYLTQQFCGWCIVHVALLLIYDYIYVNKKIKFKP